MARLHARLSFLLVCQLFAGASLALAHCPEIHKHCDQPIRTCQSNSDCAGNSDCTEGVCNEQSSATQCFITLTHAGTCDVDTQVTAAFDVQDFPSVPDQRVPAVGNLPIVTVSGNAVCAAGPSLPCVIGPAGNTDNGLPGNPEPGLVSFRSGISLSAAQLQDLANAGATQLNDQATATLCTPGPDCNATLNDLQVTGSTPVSSGCSVSNAPAGTPCQSDDNLCEAHACDGNGACVAQSNTQCDSNLCEVCNPGTGQCVVDPNDPRCAGVDIDVQKTATCDCGDTGPRNASGSQDGELVVCGGDHEDGDSDSGSHDGDRSVASAADHHGNGDGSNDQGDDDQGSNDQDSDDHHDTPPPSTTSTTIPPPPSGSPAGCLVGFTVTVTNHGSQAATNVVVSDVLPSPLVFVDATASQGSFDAASGTWQVGTLSGGASATLVIHEDRGNALDQCIENCAHLVSVDQADGNSGNDTDCVTVFTGTSADGDSDGHSGDSNDNDSNSNDGSSSHRTASLGTSGGHGDDGDSGDSNGEDGPKCAPSGAGGDHVCDEAVPAKWHSAYARWSKLLTKAAQATSHRQAATSLRKAKRVLRRMDRITTRFERTGSVSNDCVGKLRSRLEALGSETRRIGQ